jgi:tRNA(Ile)-lysidine synthetase-like protein
VTVDHRLRPESGEEIRRLQGWLSARAIRHEILAWSGAKPAAGIQEAARAARYALLDDWCRAHACLHLLTAHHREDQAETYLLRRRAGSGANGLAGMSAIRELSHCRVVRPLLGVAKTRLVMFLDAERQPFLTDPSNSNPAFARSRLDIKFNGQIFHPGQANNFYIYPAIGLATYVARPKRLTDECFVLAAQATADQVDPDLRAKGWLYPAQSNILQTEVTTATRVAEYMFENGLAQVERPKDIRSWIEGQLYSPRYERLIGN